MNFKKVCGKQKYNFILNAVLHSKHLFQGHRKSFVKGYASVRCTQIIFHSIKDFERCMKVRKATKLYFKSNIYFLIYEYFSTFIYTGDSIKILFTDLSRINAKIYVYILLLNFLASEFQYISRAKTIENVTFLNGFHFIPS